MEMHSIWEDFIEEVNLRELKDGQIQTGWEREGKKEVHQNQMCNTET